ncbi:SAM-dependent methyltransferase, partial [Streptomyces albogriseolus]
MTAGTGRLVGGRRAPRGRGGGRAAGPPEAPVLVVRNRRALRRLLFKPGELGLAR